MSTGCITLSPPEGLRGGLVLTPWGGRNVAVRTPDGMQPTLFRDLADDN
jgi:hypothetical protein